MGTIIWVVESGGLSGGVRMIFEYSTRLAKRGHKNIIASLDYQPDWFNLDNIEWWVFPDYGYMMKHLKTVRGKKAATWWKTAHFLKDGIEEGEGYYLVQDDERSYYYRPFELKGVEDTYKQGLRMFTPNLWVKDHFKDMDVAYIGQAYDPTMYKRMKLAYPARNRAITIVRRQALKGFSELGELSRYLAIKDKDVQLWTFGREPNIQLVGAHKNNLVGLPDSGVVKLYSEGTVYISTSQHEGFGLPMLEAMACGCPVVTTDSDGNYFCENEKNCLKYDKSDMLGMADGIIRVMKDQKLAKTLADGGYETAKQFSDWNAVIDKLEPILGG